MVLSVDDLAVFEGEGHPDIGTDDGVVQHRTCARRAHQKNIAEEPTNKKLPLSYHRMYAGKISKIQPQKLALCYNSGQVKG